VTASRHANPENLSRYGEMMFDVEGASGVGIVTIIAKSMENAG
jgi:hypothetical protein